MEAYVTISFLLFISVIGVLVSDNNGQPVKRSLLLLSAAEREIIETEFPKLISFNLYTRSTKDSPEKLNVDDIDGLTNSSFDPNNATIFITHGWRSSCQGESCTLIRDAYLENGDYNVILIDWSALAKFEYIWISNHVVDIAQQVSRMIDFLETQGMDTSTVTVIGSSLGAHVAGLASYYANNKANYVVALDPAGPNYHWKGQKSRVSKGDGAYVEVIHTSSVPGLNSDLGDADFYPNGALPQNGCGIDLTEGCSHSRAYQYFAESINSDGFLARSCDTFDDYKNGNCDSNPVGVMGGVIPDFNVTGRYYLVTNSQAPFATYTV